MKQILKWVLLGLFATPFLLWLFFFIPNAEQLSELRMAVKPIEAINWGDGENRLMVKTSLTLKFETEEEHHQIEVVGSDGRVQGRTTLVFSRDLWGGGFVKAMDVDDDNVLELVAWSTNGSFFLDYSADAITKKAWNEASKSARSLAPQYFNAREFSTMLGFSFTILIGIYFVCGIGFLIGRKFA